MLPILGNRPVHGRAADAENTRLHPKLGSGLHQVPDTRKDVNLSEPETARRSLVA